MSAGRISIFQLREAYKRGLIERGDVIGYATMDGWDTATMLAVLDVWGDDEADARIMYVAEQYATGERSVEWLEEQIGNALGLVSAT